MSTMRCANCHRDIAPDEPTYEIRTFLDPLPPGGVACSEACRKKCEEESKLRAMLWYESPMNPFGGRKDE